MLTPRLAEIMNKLERQQMNDILDSLMQHRPKEARRVKKLLFTFEDIAQMTAANRGKLVDQIPTERTMLALRGADPTLQDIILSCLSGRSRRMIEQELSSGAPVPQKEIMAARRAIADLSSRSRLPWPVGTRPRRRGRRRRVGRLL